MGNQSDDVPDGLRELWYPNGQKKSKCHYKAGKLEGKSTTWYKNGRKSRETHWKDGKPEGKSTTWNKKGRKIFEIRFKAGEVVGSKSYWRDKKKWTSDVSKTLALLRDLGESERPPLGINRMSGDYDGGNPGGLYDAGNWNGFQRSNGKDEDKKGKDEYKWDWWGGGQG